MNKKILLPLLIFTLTFAVFAGAAETCQKGYVLDSLRKALYMYYINPEESAEHITLGELKDLLALYIKFEGVGEEFSCEIAEKSLADKAYRLDDRIPSCSDGTKYGKCSNITKSMYCYAGRLVPRCRLCGCPEGQWCDETYVDTSKGNKGQWGKCYPLDNVTNVTFDLALRIADCATINTDCEEGQWYEGIERYGCALEGSTVKLEALNSWNSYSAQLIVNSGEHSEIGDAPSGRSEWMIFKNIPVWTGARNYNANEGFYRITVTKDGYTSKTGLIGIFGTTGADLYWSREFIGNYICLTALQQPPTCTPAEQLIVDFRSLSGTTTTNQYSGLVDVSVVGTGQSSGIAYNDAFYVFTSYLTGQPITPIVKNPFLLYVDGVSVANVTSIPSYNSQHSYKFTFDAGTTPKKINFRIGDTYVVDNSGSFTIGVCADAVGKCTDGTAYGQCSTIKPKYCQDGGLINKCQTCSCPAGQTCQADWTCCVQSGTDLVMHLPFDDEISGVANDVSGNNNSGILYGPSSVTTGKVGKALNFDGNNDYVVVADSCTLDIANAITLEAWVKFAQLPPDIDGKDWYSIILKSNHADSYGLMYGGQYVGNRLRVYHNGLTTSKTDAHVPGLSTNVWYHVVATYDGSTTKIYLNGEETEYIDRVSDNVTGAIKTNAESLYIGSENPSRPALPNWYYPFNGIIDEVKIWKRALSAEEACEEAGKTWQDGKCGTETCGEIVQISTDIYASDPRIYGDKIVWDAHVSGAPSDIFMYDLTTKTKTQITTDPIKDEQYPDIYGERIVWHDHRLGYFNIYMYDISTGQETEITTAPGVQYIPHTYGNKIVWIDDRNGNPDIYMYDISTGQEIAVINNTAAQDSLDIYGNKIVWADNRGEEEIQFNWDIYMFDLTTGQETQITTHPAWQTSPHIYGNKIVWQDRRPGNYVYDIYMYDLGADGIYGTADDSGETLITTDVENKPPAIYGDKIVWVAERNGNKDIYMYDLTTQQETRITTDPTSQTDPDIYGNKIAWQDWRNGKGDIYMTTLC